MARVVRVVSLLLLLLLDGAAGQLDVCGQPPKNTRIVGGAEAPEGAWPWLVSIHRAGSHVCGGSVITNRWVLSAAHCFPSGTTSGNTVYIGRKSQDLANPHEVSRSIVQVINHPQYSEATNDNDMALLKMDSNVTFTDYIRPVCLAEPGSTFYNGTPSWLTGWGDIASGESPPFPQNLSEVEVPIVGNRQCQCNYEGKFTITDNMICAGLAAGGKDTCQGDSGGPMVSKQNGTWIQSGVVSFGEGCARPNQPGVYARVSKYKTWINSHITGNQPGYVTFTSTGTDSDLSVNCTSVPPLTSTPAPTTTPPVTTPRAVTCGHAPQNSRLASGTSVAAGLWPWMVSVQKNQAHMCGGTLVAVDTVLSDASCFPSPLNTSGWSVVLGQVQLSANSSVRVNVTNITVSNTSGANVALLRLAFSPPLSDTIQPICLDTGLTISQGTTAYCTGWGQQGATGVLQEVQTTIQSCGNSSSSDSICTGVFTMQQGDLGGPMMLKSSGAWYQAVVLSNSSSSSNSSTRASRMTFQKLSSFKAFLQANLGKLLSPATTTTTTPSANSTTGGAPPTGGSLLCILLLLSLLRLLLWG